MTDTKITHEFDIIITVSMTEDALKSMQAKADHAMDSAAEKFPGVAGALTPFQRDLIARVLMMETATELAGGAAGAYMGEIVAGAVDQPPEGSCNAIQLQPMHTPGVIYNIELHEIEQVSTGDATTH